MKNVLLSWTLPTTRVDGSPLAPAEIAGTEVFIRVEGAPDFVLLATVPAPQTSLRQTELDSGTYEFRVVVVDKQRPPKRSAAVTSSVSVELAEPSPALGFVVSVE